jgi:hypothetical protein
MAQQYYKLNHLDEHIYTGYELQTCYAEVLTYHVQNRWPS